MPPGAQLIKFLIVIVVKITKILKMASDSKLFNGKHAIKCQIHIEQPAFKATKYSIRIVRADSSNYSSNYSKEFRQHEQNLHEHAWTLCAVGHRLEVEFSDLFALQFSVQ